MAPAKKNICGETMKSIRRITTTIKASFDGIIGKLENHDALASAAIAEAEQSSGRAKAQLWRVKQDGAAIQKRLNDLQQQAALWEDRARKSRALDEEKAIECLRRRQRYLTEVSRIEGEFHDHQKLEKQLEGGLTIVEQKINTLRQQRNLMRTRESHAEARRIANSVESSVASDIDSIFDRWETQIIGAEQQRNNMMSIQEDPLEDSFASEEERKVLKTLLDSFADEQ